MKTVQSGQGELRHWTYMSTQNSTRHTRHTVSTQPSATTKETEDLTAIFVTTQASGLSTKGRTQPTAAVTIIILLDISVGEIVTHAWHDIRLNPTERGLESEFTCQGHQPPHGPQSSLGLCHTSGTSQKSPEGTTLLNATCVSHAQILCCPIYRRGN